MKLTTQKRNALPNAAFAGPGRSYPVQNRSHAVNALARASQQVNAGNLSPATAAHIKAKAHAVLNKGAAHTLVNGIRPGGNYADGTTPLPPQPLTPVSGIRGHYADGGTVSDPSIMGFIKDRAKAAVDALTPTKAPQLAQQVVENNTGLTGKAVSETKSHNQQLQDALNLANGSPIVRGPGTGTSDSVPVNLSSGESVLPTDTTKALGSNAIARLIQATHTPVNSGVASRGMRRGGKYANGLDPYDKSVKPPESSLTFTPPPGMKSAPSNTSQGAPGFATPSSEDVAKMIGQSPTGLVSPNQQGAAQTLATPTEQSGSSPDANRTQNIRAVQQTTPIPPKTTAPQNEQDQTLPQFGDNGAGYVRNDRTGKTTTFQPQTQPQGAAQQLAQPTPEPTPPTSVAQNNAPDLNAMAQKSIGDARVAGLLNHLENSKSTRTLGSLAEQRQQEQSRTQNEQTRSLTEGNRFGNQEKSYAVQQLARTNALQDKIASMPEGAERAAAIDQYDTLTGKSKWIEGRPTHVYGENGQIVGENTNVLNARTGQPNQISNQPAKPVIPAGVAVGAKSNHPDGIFSLPDGRRATIKNGVIAAIQ